MRLYRGLTKEGKWVYGYFLVNSNNRVCIYDPEIGDIPIIPETVGQQTGLNDKNGKELDWWEGDIFDDAGVLKVIVKDKGCFWFENIKSKRRIPCYDVADSYGDWANDIKKVGNIHQPELMEQDNG